MLKNRFIRKRTRSKSGGRQPSVSSETVIAPPTEFCNERETRPNLASTEDEMKLKNGDKKGGAKLKSSNSSDDYGFLSLQKSDNTRQPRISIRTHSPQSEVDYFDESLFDIGFLQTSSERGNTIPITLGSISSSTTCPTANVKDSNSSNEMPIIVKAAPFHPANRKKESHYVNADPLKNSISSYEDSGEGYYARLSELNVHGGQIPSSTNELNFYVQKAAEQRARSRSRGRDSGNRAPESGNRGRDSGNRGRSRSARKQANTPRSRSRGCSASRDIMALYTNRPVSRGRFRENSTSPERDSTSHLRRQQSLSPATQSYQKSGSSKHISSLSNKTFPLLQEGHMDNRETANKIKQNEQKSDKTSSQHTPRDDYKASDGSSFMTLLEMDGERNIQIEKNLLAANSLKPANIKMMMIANHAPASSWAAKDEVFVKAGDIVTGIYKQNEWLFIRTDTKVGFVPYAFTKPVKVTNNAQDKLNPKLPPPVTKPVNGILKTSNHSRHRTRKSHPKFSVKVRTAADNDSLSSETSSAIVEDFVYTRKKSNFTQNHADCIVIDTDDICSNFETPNNSEETGTYCSDSGISDPSSNHSEDLDLLHSPLSLSDDHHDSGISIPTSTPRLPNERIVSVTTELLASSPYSSTKHLNKNIEPRSRYQSSVSISDMPLGPLGARLAKINLEKKDTNNKLDNDKKDKKLASDTRERARCSSTTPSSVRPEIPKDYNGPRVTVVFDYDGENDDDLAVHASDIVTVLNSEDIEWIWVQRRDGKEGFIPREYVIPLELSAQSRRRVGISLL